MKLLNLFGRGKTRVEIPTLPVGVPLDKEKQRRGSRTSLVDYRNTSGSNIQPSKTRNVSGTSAAAGNGWMSGGAWLDMGLGNMFSKRDEELNESTVALQGPELLQAMRQQVLGRNQVVSGPFGPRPIMHVHDQTGQTLIFVEEYITNVVRPLMARCPTNPTAAGTQAKRFIGQARTLVLDSVMGSGMRDEVVFGRPGPNGGLLALIDLLHLRAPRGLTQYGLDFVLPEEEKPVIFVGPGDYDSKMHVWKLTVADIVVVPQDPLSGGVDMDSVGLLAKKYSRRPVKVAVMVAYGGATGIHVDAEETAQMLRKHGFLLFWDYTTAGPGANFDITESDGAVLSPHSYPGGNDTLSVVIVKQAMLEELAVNDPKEISANEHGFYDMLDSEDRVTPEGGSLIPALRTGLAFYLRRMVGPQHITEIERKYAAIAARELRSQDIDLIGLGSTGYLDDKRRAVISFNVHATFLDRSAVKYLHPWYVVALLADLYGIYAHAESYSWGSYKSWIFGRDMTEEEEKSWDENVVKQGLGSMRPGWVTVHLDSLKTPEDVDYAMKAIQQVAQHGWKVLPLYRMDPKTGKFEHHKKEETTQPKEFGNLRFAQKRGTYFLHWNNITATEEHRQRNLEEAIGLYENAHKYLHLVNYGDGPVDFFENSPAISDTAARFRWFLLPSDALSMLMREKRQEAVNVEELESFGSKVLGGRRSTMVSVRATRTSSGSINSKG